MARECKVCGVSEEEVGISKNSLCLECAMKRAREAAYQMAAREGPYYDRWKRAMRLWLQYELGEKG